ncbi:tyrosine-type recombinase/integrase [Alienimonas sp. DA493]|uniref:tyrosine-type recombinase/integrase n=1 Tax=Alienimonas sp. DA493 TaxID=3373605 RepID=UPI003754892A
MASVSTDPSGSRRVQFTGPDRRRRTIRLGKVSKRTAEEVAGLVERVNAAALAGHAPPDADARRIADMPDALHAKFAAAGLTPARESRELGTFLAAYLADRSDAKPNTLRHLNDAAEHLRGFFGVAKPLREITPGDADEFRRHLTRGGRRGRSSNTVNRWMGRAGQFFRHAHRKGLIDANPFEGQKTTVRGNPSRMAFISVENARRVLNACPDWEWRLIFALARFGGLRCPSELAPLTWDDVHWPDPAADNPREAHGWLRITSPKTAHHPGGGERVIPLFAELLPHLRAAAEATDASPEAPCIPRLAGGTNPHTHMKRIIERSGVKPWPKLFQNLRSTRQTELGRVHPAHVVCGWMGNTTDVAAEHYLQVTDHDYARAAAEGELIPWGREPAESDAKSDARMTQNPTLHGAAPSGAEKRVPVKTLAAQGETPPSAAQGLYMPTNKLPPLGIEPRTY